MDLNYIIRFAAILGLVGPAFTYVQSIYSVPWSCINERIIPCVREPSRCDELILPPQSIELPYGLGFSQAALPAVAKAYNEKIFLDYGPLYEISDAYVPVSSPCSCVKLATPLEPSIYCLAKPIVL
ncbi:unnamed protein product [Danaus chrysippus]|uniref:(African queen) hypothetical protein n=1 Tax=Danaus chrysippus TaxID=151541 RepID=A0A8J2QYP4_9NEOP|nr:unnamed protein product [Danaus chrysippus]